MEDAHGRGRARHQIQLGSFCTIAIFVNWGQLASTEVNAGQPPERVGVVKERADSVDPARTRAR